MIIILQILSNLTVKNFQEFSELVFFNLLQLNNKFKLYHNKYSLLLTIFGFNNSLTAIESYYDEDIILNMYNSI